MTDLADPVAVGRRRVRPAVPEARQPPGSQPAGGGLLAEVAAAFEHRRLFVLLPFAVIAGLVLAAAVPAEPLALAIAALLVAALLIVGRGSLIALRTGAIAAAILLGLALLPIHGALFGTTLLARPAFGSYTATVDEVISGGPDGYRVIVSAIEAGPDARDLPIRRARIVIDTAIAPTPGDTIAGRIRFYPLPGPVLPGGYDTQFHAYFDGIGAYGNGVGAVTVTATEGWRLDRAVAGTRAAIAARIDRALGQPSAGIARALITGDQTEVTDEARETMARAGLAHVLSVSGLHLSLVAGGVFAILRILFALCGPLGFSTKRAAALGGIAAALLYFAISGGNVAALRATLMILLVLGAVVFGRQALTMRNVAIAALIILVTDPASVFRPSFQLSFAAVVALIGAWELGTNRDRRDRDVHPLMRFGAYVWAGLLTSIVAGAATLLFSVYHFQQTAPLGVLGNIASLPLVSLMMLAAAFGTLLMPVGLEWPFLLALGLLIDAMLAIAGWVAGLGAGLETNPLLAPVALLFALAALAWFAFIRGWWRLAGPALLLPAVLLFALDRRPDVLIADTTQAVAIASPKGLRLISGKPDTFAVEIWGETYGEDIMPAPDLVGCDSVACVGVLEGGARLALVRDPAGFFEECVGADLVISRLRAPAACRAGLVIDADDLERLGTHWLHWLPAEQRFEVRTAIPPGDRPWRLPPG